MERLVSYEEKELHRKCNLFGSLFKRSKDLGYDSKKFIEQVMTCELYDNLYNLDEGYDWCDECWLLREFENLKSFIKSEKFLDNFELWFMGYLYKYWTSTRKKTRQEVYRVLPFEKFDNRFSFYNTQGWDYIIDEVVEEEKCN